MPTSILLVGAGAIGSFFASRLASAPNTLVSALCRSNYAAVKSKGFRITSPKYGEYSFKPEHTFQSPEEIHGAGIKWDYVLVATKALPEVANPATLIEGMISPGTTIVLLQNGIGIEEPYHTRFPTIPILTTTTLAAVSQVSPGHIKHYAWGRISVGPYTPENPIEDTLADQKAARFVELLKAGGISDAQLHSHTSMQQVRWHKLATNAAMNPTSVLSGGTDSRIMGNDREISGHLLAVMKEVLATGEKVLGRSFGNEFATPEQTLKATRKSEPGSAPSMLMDWRNGNRMEVEVILGNPLRFARERGLEMPRLQTLYALLRRVQENAESGERRGERL
jgi:2-dehydropantoate 2-reductase